ncbi:MAG: efflux RND transporter permease subunit [Ignavibacteriae bacterium]|nr:efflux RND transporter permease subunit [Ignavibacteriota bacterium]MCB9214253.1 efflux RND transporter permease subunit [Ignavibacteria bacterium]
MIERIIDWSAHNRLLVGLLFLLLAGAGVWAVVTTPVDAIPDLSDNQVIVFTEWMGRSPQIVEDQVTYPLTTALQGLPEVKGVRAQTMFGMSFIFVIFEDGVDLYFARQQVAERITTAQTDLPSGVIPTMGPDGTGVGHIYWYTVEGEGYDLATLRSLQDWFIRYKLSSVDGVAEVASIGGFVKQYQVDVDPERLRSYGLTFSDVVRAIRSANNEVGGKLIENNDAEFFVRGQGYFESREDIEGTLVNAKSGGLPITIGMVADVQLGGDIRRGSLEKDGKGEVVGGIVVMRQNENAREVIERVKEKIAEIEIGLPKGVRIVPSYDRSPLIDKAIATLRNALVEEALIVTLIVLLFIFHVRSALRILIEIPISVLLAFLLMRAFDITSNIMSLGGIALAIGVVVDSSIVLVENAYRNIAEAQERKRREREEGASDSPDAESSEEISLTKEDYFNLAVLSAKQVGRAIFFSEAIMVISFLPVFLLEGQEGKLFHPLAWTKTFVIGSSAIVAITLVPMLMTLLMKGKFRTERENPVMRFFHALYRPILNWVLKWRKTTIAINLLALLVTIPLLTSRGTEFMPPLDEGSLLFMPVLLPNASVGEVTRVMGAQDKIIADYPEVEHVLGKVGRAETATDNAPVAMIETIILLKPESEWRPGITKGKIIADLDAQLQIPGVRNGWTQPIINRINMLATGVRTDIGLKIFGPDLDTLEHYGIMAEEILKKVPGAADVVADRVQGGVFLDIDLNEESAARYGVSVQDVQTLIETAIGGENIGVVLDGRARYPIRARYQRELRDNLESIKKILVPVSGTVGSSAITSSGMGEMSSGMGSGEKRVSSARGEMTTMGSSNALRRKEVSSTPGVSLSGLTSRYDLSGSTGGNLRGYVELGEIAKIDLRPGPSMIPSENGELKSTVFLNVRGRDMGSFVAEAKERLQGELVLPRGYTYSWSGQYENQTRAENRLLLVIPVVFLVIFLTLYLTLKDWKEASVVMLSVPFALIGGVWLISLLGYNLSIAVWVGFIALYGVAVQTGVVMVVYLHHALDKRLAERGEGSSITLHDIHEATVEGALGRLRPKLMTVATSMIGLVPIMFATGVGSDVMKPLVAPMIGGLLTSAVHVLIMTPILFIIMKERALKRGSLRKSEMAEWMA